MSKIKPGADVKEEKEIEKEKEKKQAGSAFFRLMSELGASRFLLAASLAFSLVFSALTLYIPIIVGGVIDDITRGAGILDVKGQLIKTALFAAIAALSRYASDVLSNKVVFRTVKELRKKAYKKLSRLPVSFFDKGTSGDAISRIISDTDAVGDGLLMGIANMFTGVVTIASTIIFMLGINLRMTLIIVLLTPVSLAAAAFLAKKTYRLFISQSEKRAAETAFLSESLKNLKLIKAFVREEKSARDYEEKVDDYSDCAKKALFASSMLFPSTRFVGAVIYAAVGLAGAFFVISGSLTIGGLTCFLSYAGQYSKPFNDISGVVSEMQNSVACAERVFELIDAEEMTHDGKRSIELKRGEIKFDNVSFSYGGSEPTLSGVTFTVKAGCKAALVGPTGCGKTTLINLLMRFYDADSGKITIDGTDIADVPRGDVREMFGMVLQDTFLFEDTVLENIRIGKPEASREEVVRAARLTGADMFIERMSDGYDTVINGSSELSEGERQLISVTRVMLAAPPMLILDEATSSIDTMTEMRVNAAFAKIMENRTSLIVAHRLSTVKNADLILVMKDGRIVESGAHGELMSRGGFYKELFESQFEAA